MPIALDTDVNGAAYGEHRRGAGDLVHLSVGTGAGGGAVVHGRPLHGMLQPRWAASSPRCPAHAARTRAARPDATAGPIGPPDRGVAAPRLSH
ncbi:ROK family protein [Dactylosporangium sp. CA-052675]|uniref:ROK family protein n=1 Tax=Dactylosporangium sp. CA-052675 TaxID=3239927 RepID=UPI003D8D39C9